MSADGRKSENEVVFLTPEETVRSNRKNQEDQGASPHLRRSSRKRKSIVDEGGMTKGLSSKKKRNTTGGNGASPLKGSEQQKTTMPRVPRLPPAKKRETAEKTGGNGPTTTIESLLAGMEGRLGSKIDETNNKVEQALSLVAETNTALEVPT